MTNDARRERILSISAAIIIAAATVWAFLPSLRGEFVWDDLMLIRDNPAFSAAGAGRFLFSSDYFSAFRELSWRPVCTLSFLIDYRIWGMNPAGFHAVNIAIHVLNAMLLYLLALRTGGRLASAVAAALLFALHPIQVEAVAGITFREDLLCLFFALAAANLHLTNGSHARWAASAAFVMALLSKETAIALPAALFVMEFAPPLSSGARRAVLRTAPYWVLAAVYAALRFTVFRSPAEAVVYHDGGILRTLELAASALARYGELLVFEMRQCVLYPADTVALSGNASAAVIASVVASAALILVFRRSSRAWGAAWFILFLLPVSNIIPIAVLMADRYLYVPLAGLAVLFGALFNANSLNSGTVGLSERFRQAAFVAVAAAIVIFLLNQSRLRCEIWSSETSLWTSAVECAPESAYAHNNLGKALYIGVKPDLPRAEVELKKAIALAERTPLEEDRYRVLPRAMVNLGIVYATGGRRDDARREFESAVAIWPENANAWFNLGALEMESGDTGAAARAFERGLVLNGGNVTVRLILARVYFIRNEYADAAKHCMEILKIHPGHPIAVGMLDEIDRLRNRGGK